MGEQSNDLDPSRQPTRLLRIKEVQHRIGLGRSTIYRWMSEGTFPKPVHLGGHAVAWQESELEAWIESRIREGFGDSSPDRAH